MRRAIPVASVWSRGRKTSAGGPTTAARSQPAAASTSLSATATTVGATRSNCRCRPNCWRPIRRAACAIPGPRRRTGGAVCGNTCPKENLRRISARFCGVIRSATVRRWAAATCWSASMPRSGPSCAANGSRATCRCGSGWRPMRESPSLTVWRPCIGCWSAASATTPTTRAGSPSAIPWRRSACGSTTATARAATGSGFCDGKARWRSGCSRGTERPRRTSRAGGRMCGPVPLCCSMRRDTDCS